MTRGREARGLYAGSTRFLLCDTGDGREGTVGGREAHARNAPEPLEKARGRSVTFQGGGGDNNNGNGRP